MITNAYDTTVGLPFKNIDKVVGSIKTLSLMNNLVPTQHKGSFIINHNNGTNVPVLCYPLTLETHTRETITVSDIRPFTNKKGDVENAAELQMNLIANGLQQEYAIGNATPLKTHRIVTTRAYARSISTALGRRAGLNVEETMTLATVLAYFYITRLENDTKDHRFVAANITKQALSVAPNFAIDIIEGLPWMNNIKELIETIKTSSYFFKLSNLDLKDFITVASTIWFSAMGKQVVGAALEHPALFTAICYVSVTQRVYNKTGVALQLDPKYNQQLVNGLVNGIDHKYFNIIK